MAKKGTSTQTSIWLTQASRFKLNTPGFGCNHNILTGYFALAVTVFEVKINLLLQGVYMPSSHSSNAQRT